MNGRTEKEEIQLFRLTFGPMQGQLAIAHVVTFTTMKRRINKSLEITFSLLTLGVEAAMKKQRSVG